MVMLFATSIEDPEKRGGRHDLAWAAAKTMFLKTTFYQPQGLNAPPIA
jgi:hypothetical protein